MKKWLGRLFWVPLMLLAVLFLFANRQPVSISLDPFSAEAPALTTEALPLWFWLMVMLFVGFAAGALGMWLSARPKRQIARAEHRELKTLRKELAAAAMAKPEAEPGSKAEEDDNHLPKIETASPST